MRYALQLDPEPFLRDHWQREHLMIPGGFSPFEPPADADELAGLAMDENADGRIIAGAADDWSLLRGPFKEQDYDRSGPWSLLVHGVDRHWEEAQELLGALPWLPTWRLDDVMMSYATDGGGAGPHFDHYDVFIIQGEGRRRWQIGQHCTARTPRIDSEDLNLLASFEPRHEYLMECGDVLYVPPGCAHFGVSIGESTSFSIGFRAPPLSELLARWTDDTLDALPEKLLLVDEGRDAALRAGEITARDIDRARQQLLGLLESGDGHWFGEAITTPREMAESPSKGRTTLLLATTTVRLAPGARLAWQDAEDGLTLYSAGQGRPVARVFQPMIEDLCAGRELSAGEFLAVPGTGEDLLQALLEDGTIESYDN